MSDRQAEVLAANSAFYAAFSAGDVNRMDTIWAEDALVTCTHPGWDVLVGRVHVMASWMGILSGQVTPAKVECHDAQVQIAGDLAVVTCVEHIADARIAATNVFVREDDRWRMTHHHGGQIVQTVTFTPSPDQLN
ncbi:MAG: nuclear transport factor 2 family protein [Deltaproteobacteria bacterium]